MPRQPLRADAGSRVLDGAPSWSADANALYDEWADGYDATYALPSHRRVYDLLSAELAGRLLPQEATIVDVGCGTGRMARRWLQAGHSVIGIEQSRGMLEVLRARALPDGFRLVEASMEEAEIAPAGADLVAAFGSVQYSSDPVASIARFATWARPGGAVCVYVDSLVALHLELMRAGREAEAATLLETGHGVVRGRSAQAGLRLFTSQTIANAFTRAGLIDIELHGLVVGASFWGRTGVAERMQHDEAGHLARERGFAGEPALVDLGLHIFASGRRPSFPPS